MPNADHQGQDNPLLTLQAVNLLAFDTSTETLSVAVQTTAGTVWEHTGTGGAQASASLIPTINRLMAQAGLAFKDLRAIAFGCGPGSFTGLRTACSVAQGLGFGADVPLLPLDSLLAVAEEARHTHGALRVLSLLDARMDEVYAAHYQFHAGSDPGTWQRVGGMHLLKPEAVQADAGETLAGNAFAAYASRLPPHAPRVDALPTATALLRLAPSALAAGQAVPAAQALPLYVRDKVAQTTAERAAIVAARLAPPPPHALI